MIMLFTVMNRKRFFEWCAHFQSSGVTEHNKIKTGLSKEMDIIFQFLTRTELMSTVSCINSLA